MAKIYNMSGEPLIPSIYDKKNKGREYVLRITLEDVKPVIYRKISVPSNIRLYHLAPIILRTMGWGGYHLEQFVQNRTTFYEPKEEVEKMNAENEPSSKLISIDWATVTLGDVLKKKGDSIKYIYDLGDYWEHNIKLMEIHNYPPNADREPYILEGKNACPPDDVGGTGGFQHMLDVMSNPGLNLEEWKMFKDWLPRGYDPKYFSIHDAELRVNDYLRAVRTFQQMVGEYDED